MKLFHNNKISTFKDPKTGRLLYFNKNPEFFFLVPGADLSCIVDIAETQMKSWRWKKDLASGSGGPNKYGKLLCPIFEARTEKELKFALEFFAKEYLNAITNFKKKIVGGNTRVGICRAIFVDVLVLLWLRGALLFPSGFSIGHPTCISSIVKFIIVNSKKKPKLEIEEDLQWLLETTNGLMARTRSKALYTLLSVGPKPSLESLTTDFAVEVGKAFEKYGCLERNGYANQSKSNLFFNLFDFMRALSMHQKVSTGRSLIDINRFIFFSPTPTAEKRRGNQLRTGEGFFWVTQKDPSLEALRAEAHEWFDNGRSKSSLASKAKTSLNKVFDYLIERPDHTRIPQEILRKGGVNSKELLAFLSYGVKQNAKIRILLECVDFFNWLLKKHAVFVEDDGEEIMLPGFCNPIPENTIPGWAGRGKYQTEKIPLPIIFVQMIRDILMEDNFAWARTKDSEYFKRIDPETGNFQKIFSPVKTYALLLLLILPLRLKQVRMLDSGEGDAEKYCREKGWIANDSVHAKTFGGKGCGVLRKMIDFETGSDFVGFYINTNKTGDIGKDPFDRGYEIPWEELEAIILLSDLRDWQEKFNPVDGPTPYAETKDAHSSSQSDIDRSPERFYLFRNPCSYNSHLPISPGEMKSFFVSVIRELEVRLAKAGRTNKDNSPIRLIRSRKSPIYSIHSLRVTGLTSLAQKGVPFDVLSKLVAGHATILMTLHYIKYSAGRIDDILSKASQEAHDKAEEDLERYLQDYHLGAPKRYAYNSEEALMQAKEQQSGCWKIMDHGICPNGGTLCYQGWKLEEEVEGNLRVRNVPIPHEGSVGCGLCRFFVTGPAWLIGLEAKVNELFVMAEEASSSMRKRLKEKQRLEHKKNQEGAAFSEQRALYLAEQNSQSATRNADQILLMQQGLVNLANQSVKLGLQMVEEGSEKLPMIYQCNPEELEAQFIECSKFDLYDTVCQKSVFFPSINPTLANLRRAKMLDKALSRNGKRPVLLSLTEEEQLIAANAMSRFLLHRCGRDVTNALIEGRINLDQLQIRDEEMEKAMVDACKKALLPEIERDEEGVFSMKLTEKLRLSSSIQVEKGVLNIGDDTQGAGVAPVFPVS